MPADLGGRLLPLLRLGLQAYALGIAYEFDPYFGLSISRVDPLPLEAVYDYLFKLARVRFLLADDAGAGMTGLLIRELELRGFAEPILIVCPANLAFQWLPDVPLPAAPRLLQHLRTPCGVTWKTGLASSKRTQAPPGAVPPGAARSRFPGPDELEEMEESERERLEARSRHPGWKRRPMSPGEPPALDVWELSV